MDLDYKFEISGNIENTKDGKILNVECVGKIDSYEAFKEFKLQLFAIAYSNRIEHLKQRAFDTINIKFINSHPINHHVVGFLLTLKERDKVQVNVMVSDVKLLQFFISVHLDEILNVKLF